MKLDKLRGVGPWLAYASPACLALSAVAWVLAIASLPEQDLGHAPSPSAGFYAFALTALLLVALWMLTMLAVAVDLEWIEHPLTDTPMTYVALAGAGVGTLGFLGFLAVAFTNIPATLAAVLGCAWLGGVGVYLVVINMVGRRAGIITGALPWVGVVAGALNLVAALLILAGLAVAIGGALVFSIPLYCIWSVWLGFQLRRAAPIS